MQSTQLRCSSWRQQEEIAAGFLRIAETGSILLAAGVRSLGAFDKKGCSDSNCVGQYGT